MTLLAVGSMVLMAKGASRAQRPEPWQRSDVGGGETANRGKPPAQQQPSRPAQQSSDRERDARDAEHQKAERRFWTLNLVVTVAAAFGTGAAAWYAYGAFTQARRQADIAQDALVASNRPWVMLTDMKPTNFSSDDEIGVTLRVNILVKNIGHSPAQNVSVTGRLLLDDFDPPPDQAMVSVCQEPRNGSFVIPGQALFPDREQDLDGGTAHPFIIDAKKVWEARAARINSTREYNMSVGRPDRAQTWAEALSKFPFYDALNLVGCINYRSSDNTALYQTSFMFSVSAKPGGGGLPLLGGKRPVTVPPTSTPEDPDVLVVHPRMIQRIIPGDQIRLEKPLYSTFAN